MLPADIERALYDDRTLVRVLCMRRTLFAVPRELVPVVYAACTRTIAARERRLEKMIEDSAFDLAGGLADPRVEGRAPRGGGTGEAFTRDVVADVPTLAKKLRLGAGSRFESTPSAAARVLPQLAMQGKLVLAAPARLVGERPVPLGADQSLARRGDRGRRPRGGSGRARPALARGL